MRACVALVVLALTSAVSATARASEIEGTTGPPQGRDGVPTPLLTLVGSPAADAVDIGPLGPQDGLAPQVVVHDPAGLAPTGTCRALDPTRAVCPAGTLRASMGAGDDRLVVAGDVREPSLLRGGPGDDVLRGGGGPDVVEGGPGADDLQGGPGDRVTYADSGAPVSYDGRTGRAERADGVDRLGGFSTVEGGPGDDVLRAPDAGGVTLLGADGDDELLGGPGRDVLDGGRGRNDVRGAGGDDEVRGSGRLLGGPGDDRLAGRSTDDRIDGGPGSDDVRTNGGDDRVDLADGQIDRLDCTAARGPGAMRATLDGGDGSHGCRGLRRRGRARPALFGPGFDREDLVGDVLLAITCPQPLRRCPVLVTLRRTSGAIAGRERLVVAQRDATGLALGFDVGLRRAAQVALRRAGRLALTATLEGWDADGRPVRSSRRFVLRDGTPTA